MVGSESRILDILATIFSLRALSPQEIEALSSVKESCARSLTRYAYREFKNNPLASVALSELLRKAKASELSISQWFEQIVVVYDWLFCNARRANFGDIVEYISCAVEGSALQAGHDLTWYLEQHGFERSEPN